MSYYTRNRPESFTKVLKRMFSFGLPDLYDPKAIKAAEEAQKLGQENAESAETPPGGKAANNNLENAPQTAAYESSDRTTTTSGYSTEQMADVPETTGSDADQMGAVPTAAGFAAMMGTVPMVANPMAAGQDAEQTSVVPMAAGYDAEQMGAVPMAAGYDAEQLGAVPMAACYDAEEMSAVPMAAGYDAEQMAAVPLVAGYDADPMNDIPTAAKEYKVDKVGAFSHESSHRTPTTSGYSTEQMADVPETTGSEAAQMGAVPRAAGFAAVMGAVSMVAIPMAAGQDAEQTSAVPMAAGYDADPMNAVSMAAEEYKVDKVGAFSHDTTALDSKATSVTPNTVESSSDLLTAVPIAAVAMAPVATAASYKNDEKNATPNTKGYGDDVVDAVHQRTSLSNLSEELQVASELHALPDHTAKSLPSFGNVPEVLNATSSIASSSEAKTAANVASDLQALHEQTMKSLPSSGNVPEVLNATSSVVSSSEAQSAVSIASELHALSDHTVENLPSSGNVPEVLNATSSIVPPSNGQKFALSSSFQPPVLLGRAEAPYKPAITSPSDNSQSNASTESSGKGADEDLITAVQLSALASSPQGQGLGQKLGDVVTDNAHNQKIAEGKDKTSSPMQGDKSKVSDADVNGPADSEHPDGAEKSFVDKIKHYFRGSSTDENKSDEKEEPASHDTIKHLVAVPNIKASQQVAAESKSESSIVTDGGEKIKTKTDEKSQVDADDKQEDMSNGQFVIIADTDLVVDHPVEKIGSVDSKKDRSGSDGYVSLSELTPDVKKNEDEKTVIDKVKEFFSGKPAAESAECVPTEDPTTPTKEVPTASTKEVATASAKEVSMDMINEVPTATTTEVLAASSKEVPMDNTNEVPITLTGELPTVPSKEAPTGSANEGLTVSTKEVPAVSVNEVPTVSTKEVTTVSTNKLPTVSKKEAPTVSESEGLTVSTKEAPTVSESEGLTVSTKEAPTVSESEGLTVSTKEAPTVSESEVPTISTKEIPTVSANELHTVPTKRAPTISENDIPTVSTQAVPTASANEFPLVSTKEAPTDFANEVPTIAAKEVPSVASTGRVNNLVVDSSSGRPITSDALSVLYALEEAEAANKPKGTPVKDNNVASGSDAVNDPKDKENAGHQKDDAAGEKSVMAKVKDFFSRSFSTEEDDKDKEGSDTKDDEKDSKSKDGKSLASEHSSEEKIPHTDNAFVERCEPEMVGDTRPVVLVSDSKDAQNRSACPASDQEPIKELVMDNLEKSMADHGKEISDGKNKEVNQPLTSEVPESEQEVIEEELVVKQAIKDEKSLIHKAFEFFENNPEVKSVDDLNDSKGTKDELPKEYDPVTSEQNKSSMSYVDRLESDINEGGVSPTQITAIEKLVTSESGVSPSVGTPPADHDEKTARATELDYSLDASLAGDGENSAMGPEADSLLVTSPAVHGEYQAPCKSDDSVGRFENTDNQNGIIIEYDSPITPGHVAETVALFSPEKSSEVVSLREDNVRYTSTPNLGANRKSASKSLQDLSDTSGFASPGSVYSTPMVRVDKASKSLGLSEEALGSSEGQPMSRADRERSKSSQNIFITTERVGTFLPAEQSPTGQLCRDGRRRGSIHDLVSALESYSDDSRIDSPPVSPKVVSSTHSLTMASALDNPEHPYWYKSTLFWSPTCSNEQSPSPSKGTRLKVVQRSPSHGEEQSSSFEMRL